jgi:hypothetical protein
MNQPTRSTGKYSTAVMPDVIRHPLPVWIPAFAGMTNFGMFNRRSNIMRLQGLGPLRIESTIQSHPSEKPPQAFLLGFSF